MVLFGFLAAFQPLHLFLLDTAPQLANRDASSQLISYVVSSIPFTYSCWEVFRAELEKDKLFFSLKILKWLKKASLKRPTVSISNPEPSLRSHAYLY